MSEPISRRKFCYYHMSTSLGSSAASQPQRQPPCKRTTKGASGAGPPLPRQTASVWGHVERKEPPVLLHRMETVNSLATDTACMFVQRRRTHLPHTTITLPGCYCDKTILHHTWTPMSLAALHRRAKRRKTPKCPFTDEWIWKTAYIHTEAPRKSCQFFRINSPFRWSHWLKEIR